MLPRSEQELLTDLMDGVSALTAAADGVAVSTIFGGDSQMTSFARTEFGGAANRLHDELMYFAEAVHSLLYAPPSPAPRWLSRPRRVVPKSWDLRFRP